MHDQPLVPRPPRTSAVEQKMARWHADVLDEVRRAIAEHEVVVIGMAWNPHVRKARRALDAAGIEYRYLGYGNYLTGWRARLAIKIWSGWATFPQVYVRGVLVGGNSDLRQALADGTIDRLRSEAGAA